MNDLEKDKFGLLVVDNLVNGSISHYNRLLIRKSWMASLLEREEVELNFTEQQTDDIRKIISACVEDSISSLFSNLDTTPENFIELKIIVDGYDITKDEDLQHRVLESGGWVEKVKSS